VSVVTVLEIEHVCIIFSSGTV